MEMILYALSEMNDGKMEVIVCQLRPSYFTRLVIIGF